MHTEPRRFTLESAPLRAPDPAPDVLVPIVLLPAQLRWGARRDSQTSGPHALMLAVLEDAIRCLLTPGGSGQVARDAEAWIRADDTTWPMSFRNICEALGFAPERLRAALLARAAAGQSAIAPPQPAWDLQLRRGKTRTRAIGVAQRWAVAS